MGSSWARKVGSSLLAAKSARERETAKAGSSARPALTAERASSSRPSCARAAPNTKCGRGIISVGLDRPPKPRDRLLPRPRWFFAMPALSHPDVSHRIARTEAEGLGNVSLCFFGATDKNLTQSDNGMGVGEISIQRQRMFTFGDALCGALGRYVDISQAPYGRAHGRDRRQGFGQLRFGRSEGRHGIGHKRSAPASHVRARRSNERSTLSGSAASARSKKLRACATLSGVRPLLSQAKP